MENSMYTFDKGAGIVLFLLTLVYVFATCVTDAWWQLYGACICAVLSLAAFAAAGKELKTGSPKP